MRCGLALPQYGRFADPRFCARVAAAAEELGYAGLWAGDRLLCPLAPRDPYPGGTLPEEHRTFLDPLTLLTVAAGATRRVRLGTSALTAFWWPPVVLARTLTTIDLVSAGRLDVGLGLGWSSDEYAAAGVPWHGRAARLEETLDVLERVWGADPVRHDGTHWQVPPSTIRPKPVRRPPILLGGLAPETYERIGRRADGWLAVGLPLEDLATAWKEIARHAEASGRDPAALRLVLRVNPRRVDRRLLDYLRAAAGLFGAEPLLDLQLAARDLGELLDLAAWIRDEFQTPGGSTDV